MKDCLIDFVSFALDRFTVLCSGHSDVDGNEKDGSGKGDDSGNEKDGSGNANDDGKGKSDGKGKDGSENDDGMVTTAWEWRESR
jgi:hypothetical protein